MVLWCRRRAGGYGGGDKMETGHWLMEVDLMERGGLMT